MYHSIIIQFNSLCTIQYQIEGDLRNDNQVIKWMLDELKQQEIKSVTVLP